jgi:GTP cyclohydrolase II
MAIHSNNEKNALSSNRKLSASQKRYQYERDIVHLLPSTLRETVADLVRRSLIREACRITVSENGSTTSLDVERIGLGPISTDFGDFWMFKFKVSDSWQDYTAIVKADLDSSLRPIFRSTHDIPLRIDSGCETGQIFGDLTCECRNQLNLAMQHIEEAGEGIVICIPHQDGRGKGIASKLATLTMQSYLNLDTVQAAEVLHDKSRIDDRTYGGAIAVLKFLDSNPTHTFKFLTNNPSKRAALAENRILFHETAHVVPPTEHTHRHLLAKQERLGHHGLVEVLKK